MTDVGDVVTTRATIRDANDNLIDATVTHTYTKPDGSTGNGSIVHDGAGRYHADIAVDQPGVWKWKFVASGAATGTQYGSFAATVAWTTPPPFVPSLREVGDYVPTRTIPVGVPGSAVPLGTFDTTTVPTDEQVDRVVQAAAAWVTSRTGSVDATLYDTARAVAAVRAAAFVELAYPQRDADVSVYQALFDQSEAMVEALVAANETAGQPAPGEGSGSPIWSFPDPCPNLDTYPVSW